MKKIMTVALVLGAMYSSANAMDMKPYVGLEGSYSMTKIDNDYLGNPQVIDDSDKKFNAGVVGGLQFNVNEKFYFGGELYLNTGKMVDQDEQAGYTLVNSSTGNVEGYGVESQKMTLDQYFGLRIDAGYNFNDKISAFAFVGLNYNRYESEYHDLDTDNARFDGSFNKTLMTPSFGLGISYNFTKNLQAKLSYEFSKFKVKDDLLARYQRYWNDDEDKNIDMTINTFRLGVNYLF